MPRFRLSFEQLEPRLYLNGDALFLPLSGGIAFALSVLEVDDGTIYIGGSDQRFEGLPRYLTRHPDGRTEIETFPVADATVDGRPMTWASIADIALTEEGLNFVGGSLAFNQTTVGPDALIYRLYDGRGTFWDAAGNASEVGEGLGARGNSLREVTPFGLAVGWDGNSTGFVSQRGTYDALPGFVQADNFRGTVALDIADNGDVVGAKRDGLSYTPAYWKRLDGVQYAQPLDLSLPAEFDVGAPVAISPDGQLLAGDVGVFVPSDNNDPDIELVAAAIWRQDGSLRRLLDGFVVTEAEDDIVALSTELPSDEGGEAYLYVPSSDRLIHVHDLLERHLADEPAWASAFPFNYVVDLAWSPSGDMLNILLAYDTGFPFYTADQRYLARIPRTWIDEYATHVQAIPPIPPDEGSSADFVFRLTAESTMPVDVTYETISGEAGEADFVHTTDTVTIPARQTEVVVSVDTLDDRLSESLRESFSLRVTAVDGAVVDPEMAVAEAFVIDDEVLSTPSISRMIRDFNTETERSMQPFSSKYWTVLPDGFGGLGRDGANWFLFLANDGTHGEEFWVSDGSPESTHLLFDLEEGEEASGVNSPVLHNSQLYFGSNSGFWRSDGTRAGTTLISDRPGRVTSVALVGDTFLFAGDHKDLGRELWMSDGTAEGTAVVKNLAPGFDPSSGKPKGSDPQLFTVRGSEAFFIARTGDASPQTVTAVWKTDGTLDGTEMIAAHTSQNHFPQFQPVLVGDHVFFTGIDPNTTYTQLYRADPDGEIHQVTSFTRWTNGQGFLLYPFNDRLLFNYPLDDDGDLWSIGVSDTAPEKIADIHFHSGATVDDIVYFGGGVGGLWKTNGTSDGTVEVYSALERITNVTAHDGSVFFRADDVAHGAELWTSDGTEEGTRLVRDIWPAADTNASVAPNSLFSTGDHLLFTARDAKTGWELWKSDGTEPGTQRILDINQNTLGNFYFDFDGLLFQDSVYFVNIDPEFGTELWIHQDGTEPALLKDIHPGQLGVNEPKSSRPQNLTEFAGRIFFHADDGVDGRELWVSDGTSEGTEKFLTLYPGHRDSDPDELTVLGDRLLFVAESFLEGRELFQTDGTPEGTEIVRNIAPGNRDANPQNLTVVGDRVFFTADDLETGEELWVSDGTSEGTHLVRDILPGTRSPQIRSMTAFAGKLLFIGYDDEHGSELWISDGTDSGTQMVTEVIEGADGFNPEPSLVVFGDAVYFAGPGKTAAGALWRTDGTDVGTFPIRDFEPSRSIFGSSFGLTGLTPVEGGLFFAAENGDHGRELWFTDGTAENTAMVVDLYPGAVNYGRVLGNSTNSSGPGNFLKLDHRVIFSADDGVRGRQLWISDGTPDGTYLLDNLASEYGDRPENMTVIGQDLYFTAHTRTHGRELRTLPLAQIASWQNIWNPNDSNFDGTVSPLDALVIVNYLNRGGGGVLSPISLGQILPPPFLDVNGDSFATPIDVLRIVNFLNRVSLASEAEQILVPVSLLDTNEPSDDRADRSRQHVLTVQSLPETPNLIVRPAATWSTSRPIQRDSMDPTAIDALLGDLLDEELWDDLKLDLAHPIAVDPH